MPSDPRPAPTSPQRRSTRWAWVLMGAVVMGGVALGTGVLALRTGVLQNLGGPRIQFWAMELASGLGYFLGGFLIALLSPGRTTREPMYAAGLAFLGQTGILWYADLLAITPAVFFVMLLIDMILGHAGARLGERITGAI